MQSLPGCISALGRSPPTQSKPERQSSASTARTSGAAFEPKVNAACRSSGSARHAPERHEKPVPSGAQSTSLPQRTSHLPPNGPRSAASSAGLTHSASVASCEQLEKPGSQLLVQTPSMQLKPSPQPSPQVTRKCVSPPSAAPSSRSLPPQFANSPPTSRAAHPRALLQRQRWARSSLVWPAAALTPGTNRFMLVPLQYLTAAAKPRPQV